MKKIWTFTVTKEESKKLRKILKDYTSIKRKDVDKTKVFKLYDLEIVNVTVVCSEELFTEINTKLNGVRIY